MARFRRLSDRAVQAFDDARWSFFTPAAPTSVTATAGNAQAVVSWTAPAIVVPPVTDYVVQFSSNSGSSWTTFSDGTSTSTSATVTGLTNDTAYTFRVAAVNGIGTGAFSSASSAVTPTVNDPFFSDVSLLLPFNGNLTDASSSPKTITAYGNAAATGAAKFGSASLTLDGDGDYVSAPSSEDFDLGASYTVECWIRPADSTSNGGIVCRGSYSSPTAAWSGLVFSMRRLGGDGFTRFYFYGTTSANEQYVDVSNSNFPVNTWTHLAMVRSGTTGTIYANGSSVGTISSLNTNAASSDVVSIGLWANTVGNEWFNGQIDEVRITRGVARTITAAPTAAFPTS